MIWQKIISLIKSKFIDFQRSFDHTLARVRGVPLGRFSKITPNLFLGGQPYVRGLRTLKKWGITAVVSMRETIPFAFYASNFKVLHLPTVDQTPVKLTDLQKGVLFIDEQIKNNGKVYIHCRFGEGRGPSMVIAYLISQGITYDDAIAQVRKVRTFIRPTIEQITRLKEFETLYIEK